MSKDITRITAASEQTSESAVLAIEVIDLCKSFKDFHAVDHLSLSVKQGRNLRVIRAKRFGQNNHHQHD